MVQLMINTPEPGMQEQRRCQLGTGWRTGSQGHGHQGLHLDPAGCHSLPLLLCSVGLQPQNPGKFSVICLSLPAYVFDQKWMAAFGYRRMAVPTSCATDSVEVMDDLLQFPKVSLSVLVLGCTASGAYQGQAPPSQHSSSYHCAQHPNKEKHNKSNQTAVPRITGRRRHRLHSLAKPVLVIIFNM